MPFPFKKSSRNSRNSNCKRSKSFRYETLEDRRLLASVVGYEIATGALTVNLTAANDVAQISILNNNIAVNGSDSLNTIAGVQTAAYTDLRSITITGSVAFAGQNAIFLGNYSVPNGANIQSITVVGVNNATFLGNYETTSLDITLLRSFGQISDGSAGQVVVNGATSLNANDNSIILDNANNDFRGNVNVRTGGTARSIVLNDANDIQFTQVESSGNFVVTAGGDITDAAISDIQVTGDGTFNAVNVTLGDNPVDDVNFARVNATTTGDFTLVEDSNVVLLDINADNLNVSTTGGIFDGRYTTINVNNVATFDGDSRIRIGENGGDTFNAGSVNFNSDGHVHIWENSGTNITGTNTALSFNVYSEGDVTDSLAASTTVTNIAGFEGTNIILGESALDQFNAGAMYFATAGDFNVTEDSATHIIETKNFARRMFLTSAGAITDGTNAQITVERIASFVATSVNLGETGIDSFNAGSIMFNTPGQFRINENSSTNIVGINSAENALITSAGAITNVFTNVENGNGATISVSEVASFTGTQIDLGNEANDVMNFGSLQVNSPGTASVSEDSGTHMAINSSVNQLNLVSAGAVTDALTGTINVNGLARITGTSIVIGETADDTFNATSVTLNATGDVEVTENSGLNLSGISSAANMKLVAAGNLTDSQNAETRVSGLLDVSGLLVNMGSETTDVLEMGTLRFTSDGPSNTFITADSDINLVGTSLAGDRMLLTTTGNITDAPTADVQATNQAVLQGVDIIIGELATDCFDIINGGAGNLFVLASGIENVTVGC